MATSQKELIAQANLLDGKATKKDLAILNNARHQEKYGILDIDAMRQMAIGDKIVSFSDNIKALSDIAKTADKNSDKISAIKAINDMMDFTAGTKKPMDVPENPLQELSGVTNEQIEAMINKLAGKGEEE